MMMPQEDALKNKDALKDDMPRFIHLHVHSAYSLLEGAIKIKDLVHFCVQDNQPAIAISDSNNLFGALEFTQQCLGAGIQPIIGCQLMIDFEEKEMDAKTGGIAEKYPSIVVLACNEEGYAHLMQLVSKAYLDKNDIEVPHIKAGWLADLCSGLIVLSGGVDGPLNKALAEDKSAFAVERLEFFLKNLGDRFYIELQRPYAYDRHIEAALIELAYSHKVPLVATNEAYFLDKTGYKAQDALLAVAEGQIVSNHNRRRLTEDHYLKSQEEMCVLFADLPEALANSVEIAQRCCVYAPNRAPILPRFLTQEDKNKKSEDEAL